MTTHKSRAPLGDRRYAVNRSQTNEERRTPPLVGDECPCPSCQREMQHIMGCMRDPANKGRAFHG